MFRNKKILEQIEFEKQQLLSIKAELKKEKQELLFIKEQLDDTTSKVDISDIYVWEDGGIYSIVRLEVYKFRGKDYYGNDADGYKSTLIDIFTNNIVYQKSSANLIKSREPMYSNPSHHLYYAKFFPLHGADKNLLAYTDKKVPLYVIQQLYYKLNNVDVNAYMSANDWEPKIPDENIILEQAKIQMKKGKSSGSVALDIKAIKSLKDDKKLELKRKK